jgi:hypothetical protein
MRKSPTELRAVATRLREQAAKEAGEGKKRALLLAAAAYETIAAIREKGRSSRPGGSKRH